MRFMRENGVVTDAGHANSLGESAGRLFDFFALDAN
jgi:hypothetical protein